MFPFVRFPGVDTILGPEMKSTGEVMGGADNFGAAFSKAMMGAGQRLPEQGCVFISVNNSDKQTVLPIARDLAQLGFTLAATRGTAAFLRAHGLEVDVMYKVNEGRPTSPITSSTATSTWSSTRRSAATRSSTTAPCAAPRRWRRCRASRR